MTRRLSILALVALSMVAMATAASAAYFTAPEYVIADENGHFMVSMAVYAGSQGEAVIDAEHLVGLENCDENRLRELDCSITIATGEQRTFIYEGNVLDASVDGLVELGVEFCNNLPGFSANIQVLHYGYVATESGSWDTLKAQYR